MTADSSNSIAALWRGDRLWQPWVDLSLRTKLLLFALGLVTLPGLAFALFAFSGARAALEREIGIQLHQTAELGADALAAALATAQGDARSWASQDVMRELLVADLDKRVSRFLRAVKENKPTYLEVLCVDRDGVVIAASSGGWIGRNLSAWEAVSAARHGGAAVRGPTTSPDFARETIDIAVPIENPDPPGGAIGTLILVYDWGDIQNLLDGIRVKLASLGKHVAAVVVDREGRVIGGVSFDGGPAQQSALAGETFRGLGSAGYGRLSLSVSTHAPVGVLVGAATVTHSSDGWSVWFIERTTEALAAVRSVRTRWIVVIGAILLIGLGAATLLARQVMRPLNEVTQATSDIAAHPTSELPLLPVRSRNEVGQLATSFNKMTIELKRSQEEALAAAKFAFAGELAAMVAHEVRTPLSVMRSCAQMLAPGAADGAHATAASAPLDHGSSRVADNGELVDTIVAEVDRVERVVTGLIQLARPLTQQLESVRLQDLLARAVDFVAAEARRQRIGITCDYAEAQPWARCDPEQIYQVVLNLIVNALQALPPGGCISLRTLPAEAAMVGFEVADNGPGVPREIQARLFQPFVSGREEGTGLGLAFVDRIIKAHGGNVTLHSSPGRGTIFQIRLPVALGAPAGAPRPPEA